MSNNKVISYISRPAGKITATLFASRSLITGGIIVMTPALSIVSSEVSGNEALAGVPSAVIQFAVAIASYAWGIIWDRIGRRRGLSLGLGFTVIGAIVSLMAVQLRSFPIFLLGMIGLGFGRAASQMSRFVAAEVNPPSHRGRAISYVVLGGTIGAVVGPLLFAPSGQWALGVGLDKLAGPFGAGLVLFVLGTVVVYIGLRPEPLELSREVAKQFPDIEHENGEARSFSTLLRQPAVLVAVVAVVIAQAVMVMIMGITSLHMRNINLTDIDISIVFSAHTLGMFAFSIFTGRLADKWGRGQVIITGTVITIASAIIAPLSSQLWLIALALFLLGVGWNFCYVAGSALLADQLSFEERARTQGANDLLISLAASAGSLGSGPVYAVMGYGMINLIGGAANVLPLVLTIWWYHRYQRPRIAAYS
jgi:MFS family permease